MRNKSFKLTKSAHKMLVRNRMVEITYMIDQTRTMLLAKIVYRYRQRRKDSRCWRYWPFIQGYPWVRGLEEKNQLMELFFQASKKSDANKRYYLIFQLKMYVA